MEQTGPTVGKIRLGRVAEVWRYPVRGLQGEKLTEGLLTESGVAGDHTYVLRTREQSKVLDPLTHSAFQVKTTGLPGMLELRARLTGDAQGEHELSILAGDRELFSSNDPHLRALSSYLGREVEVARYPRIVETRVRDGRTLHLLTNSSLRKMSAFYPAGDFDARRFRPNLLVDADGGRAGFVEEAWVKQELQVGAGPRLMVTKSNTRCKLTTLKQAGIEEDKGILQTIDRENSRNPGVMCTVLNAGMVGAGSTVTLVRPDDVV